MAAENIPHVLLIEDTPSLARLYTEHMRKENCTVELAETGAAALQAIAARVPEAVLLDLNLPDMHGLEILKHVTQENLPTSVVVITAHGSVQTAVDAMRAGAFDFIVKPFTPDRMLVTVRNALERQRLTRIVESYKEDFDRKTYCGFVGASLAMQAVYRIIDGAAPSKATVFITGESGTGKEVCAEAIHARSPRGEAPFVALNCAAIPRELIESEIFGHVKGAFTGAVANHDGAASRADGGTLFLDEICEMDQDLQSKLLRFVQTGSFQKVGGSQTEKVDVRFVCATNRDPLAEVEAGRFREDLYYRLHVIPIALPPLRDREDDVVAIAEHFLDAIAAEENKAFNAFAADARAALKAYDWPGNIRQLQNIIRNVVVLNDGEEVTLAMLPPPLNGQGAQGRSGDGAATPFSVVGGRSVPGEGAAPDDLVRPLWQIEKDAIEQAIALCEGNIPKAALLLDISASTIYRKRIAWQKAEESQAADAGTAEEAASA